MKGGSSGGLEFHGATISGALERGWPSWDGKGDPLACKHWGPLRPPWARQSWCGSLGWKSVGWDAVGCSKGEV